MIVEKIEAIPFRIPLKKPSRWGAHGKRDAQEHVLVRVYTKNGAVGVSEAPARPTIYGETQVSIVNIISETFAPQLVGLKASDREGYQSVFAATPFNLTAKGALDIALHDAAAQECNLSLAEYLGGSVRDIEVSYMLSLSSNRMQEFLDEAAQIREKTGIRAWKVKAGTDPDGDVARVKALREASGRDAFIFIDANQLYSPDVAIRTINRMAEFDLAMAEEPVPVNLGPYRKRVADNITVPILADDSVFTLTDARRELLDGAIGVVGIKTSRTGIYDSMRIVHLAEAFGLPCWIGSQGVSGVGALGSAQFAAAFRNIPVPSDLSTPIKQLDDLLENPIDIRDGKLIVPRGPGIGAKVDEKKLAQFRVD